jgi:hypothetical protein
MKPNERSKTNKLSRCRGLKRTDQQTRPGQRTADLECIAHARGYKIQDLQRQAQANDISVSDQLYINEHVAVNCEHLKTSCCDGESPQFRLGFLEDCDEGQHTENRNQERHWRCLGILVDGLMGHRRGDYGDCSINHPILNLIDAGDASADASWGR